jgi:hypothetical protein
MATALVQWISSPLQFTIEYSVTFQDGVNILVLSVVSVLVIVSYFSSRLVSVKPLGFKEHRTS